MPQGKLKAKAKRPAAAKPKKKGKATTKRANAPITPKKAKQTEAQKLKKNIKNQLYVTAEEEIRAVALEGKKAVTSPKKATSSAAGAKKKTKTKRK